MSWREYSNVWRSEFDRVFVFSEISKALGLLVRGINLGGLALWRHKYLPIPILPPR